MLAAFIAASATPNPVAGHDAYAWWSDIWLPAIVGSGQFAIAAVAVGVAVHSNRLARAATKSAERSNAIARRALQHEQDTSQREVEHRAEMRRQDYATRYLEAIHLMLEELAADPESWIAPIGNRRSAAFERLAPLTMEEEARRIKCFPGDAVIGMVKRAAALGGDQWRMQLARAFAHMIVDTWVEDPNRVAPMERALTPGFEALVDRGDPDE